MAALKDEVKRFIVKQLACYDTPTQVSEAVKEEFGLDVPRQQIATYDPEKYVGRQLSVKWKVLFYDTRKRFRDEVSDIPIASRAYRLRVLGRIAAHAERNRNMVLTVQVIEQAAKEVGDVFVNKSKADPAGQQPPTPVQIVIGVKDAARRDDGQS